MFSFVKRKSRPKTCFVISAPRSGSTWLQTALNSHPEVFCTEHRFFGDFFELWPDPNGDPSPRLTLDKYISLVSGYYRWDGLGLGRDRFQTELTQVLCNVFHDFARKQSGKQVIADKITPYLNSADIVADGIERYFRDSRIVFLVRDGRDVLTSGVFDWMARADEGSARHRLFIEGDHDVRLQRFFNGEDIRTWCGYWNEAFETAGRFKDRMHVVRYEAMKKDQATELGELLEFLGVNAREKLVRHCVNDSSFYKMSKGREPGQMKPSHKVRKGVSGDWKNYFTTKDALEFLQHSGSSLISWGYENDDQWISKLPNHLDLKAEQI